MVNVGARRKKERGVGLFFFPTFISARFSKSHCRGLNSQSGRSSLHEHDPGSYKRGLLKKVLKKEG
jgi:hypothetical protein